MRTISMSCAVALLCAASACIQTPENGAVVNEGSVVYFDGYAPAGSGDVEIQAEVITGYRPKPECLPSDPTKPPLKPQVCRNFPCTPTYPDCSGPGIPVFGWQTVTTVRPSSSKGNLFGDQNYDLVVWSADIALPSAAFHTIQGRSGESFRGARVRALIVGKPFYTVKPQAVSCWSANHSTLDQWISACTPSTDNQVLELRSSTR